MAKSIILAKSLVIKLMNPYIHTQITPVSIAGFPKDRNVMKKWIDALNQSNWEPNVWSKVCSVHFSDLYFYGTKNGLRRLTQDAVPSLFLTQSLSAEPGPSSAKVSSDLVEDTGTLPIIPEQHSAEDQPINSPESPTQSKNPFDADITDTPRKRKLKQEIVRLNVLAKRRRLRCKALSASNQRLRKKIENLSHLLNELKEKQFINQEQADLLESCGVSAAALIKRMRHRGKEYSPELRTFALTLYFYSPKAYCYIRSSFNTCLPHPTTIRKWYQCINATPGFTTHEAL
ncbi:THAP domain-containing protein [Phthorimaea operculella]|nr:THAP domain-containing protein [Phthorimaea operculella]